jgi:UDP-2,3-diacylglucosamine hydrolase
VWKNGAGSAPLGLIAGHGEYPVLFAKAARALSRPVIVFGIEGFTDKSVEEFASETHYLGLGELGRLVELLKLKKVKHIAFAGSVPKKKIYDPALQMDATAQSFIRQTSNKGDDHLLRALGLLLKVQCGADVVDPRVILKEAVAPKGVLTRRKPSGQEAKDLKLGFEAAKHVGRMDIGQTVVVKDGVILAVEALEGTDLAIKRGGELGNGGVTVVKVSKPNQDLRFDLPCVGVHTVDALKAARAGTLGVEAGKTILISKDRFIEAADIAGISVVGL